MSGHWIRLHDTRVNVGALAIGDWRDMFPVINCLANLFDVPSICDVTDDDEFADWSITR